MALFRQNRVNIFALPHKACELMLFNLGNELNAMDFYDSEELRVHKKHMYKFISFLASHMGIEDDKVWPQFAERIENVALSHSGLTAMQEHIRDRRKFKVIKDKLDDIIHTKDKESRGLKFEDYHFFIRDWIVDNLIHLHNEEELLPEIWKAFSDDELMAITEDIMSLITPTEFEVFLMKSFASLNVHERILMLNLLKEKTNKSFFEGYKRRLFQKMGKQEIHKIEELMAASTKH